MNDKIEKFRSYIDDEMDIAQKSAFEKELSSVEKQEIAEDLLIREILLESSQELPEGYLESLNMKLEGAYSEEFSQERLKFVQEKHSLKSILLKCKELAIELFETFKRPRYAIGLASLVIVIAIAANINKSLFVENSFYKSVSSQMPMQQNEDSENSYEDGMNNRLESFESVKEVADSASEKSGISSGHVNAMPKSSELKEESGSDDWNSTDAVSKSQESAQKMSGDFNHAVEKKIIYSAYLEVETENYGEFEKKFERILSLFSAIVDSKNIRSYKVEEDGADRVYKHAEIVIRVDSKKFFECLSEFQAGSDVIQENIGSEDITLIYQDSAQKKKNLETREAALLKLMEKAQTMEEIITVDREISTVRQQIEAYGDKLLKWDDQVKYSTIRIYVTEVDPKKPKIKPVPKNFAEKIADTFIISINNLTYFAQNVILLFVYNLVNIAVVILGIAFAFVVVKRRKKKH